MFKDFLIVGSGSAGLLMAMAIRRTMPEAQVRILRSPEIGVIGVGESTTPNVPKFLFEFLGLNRRDFYARAEPTWKLGIEFIWGPRTSFQYPFEIYMDARLPTLPRPMGYYAEEDCTNLGEAIALMLGRRAFPRKATGGPDLSLPHAFHLENAKLVEVLEASARGMGVEFIDGTFDAAERGPMGVSALVLKDGRKFTADFFVDASGFRRELIGRVMQEPFIGFESSLFNDRALLASWQRGADEPILPYTTAETMDNGWAWRIDHEHVINRGYVYSSVHCTDEQARAEFAAKNPKASINDRILRFNTGRFQRSWVDNVLAIGNSCGFVEPLEATSLMVICWQAQTFCEMVSRAGATEHIRDLYNRLSADVWDEIRDFLSLHFKVNTRIDTPYWLRCRAETQSPGLGAVLDFYQDAGPTEYARYTLANRESQFGMEGFLVQLVGNKVPYRNRHQPTREELHFVGALREKHRNTARTAFTVEQTLAFIRHPEWKWNYETKPPESRLYKGTTIPAQYVSNGLSRPRF